jgi:hypothetical protein
VLRELPVEKDAQVAGGNLGLLRMLGVRITLPPDGDGTENQCRDRCGGGKRGELEAHENSFGRLHSERIRSRASFGSVLWLRSNLVVSRARAREHQIALGFATVS